MGNVTSFCGYGVVCVRLKTSGSFVFCHDELYSPRTCAGSVETVSGQFEYQISAAEVPTCNGGRSKPSMGSSKGSTMTSNLGFEKNGNDCRGLPDLLNTRCGVEIKRPPLQSSSMSPTLRTRPSGGHSALIHSLARLRTSRPRLGRGRAVSVS